MTQTTNASFLATLQGFMDYEQARGVALRLDQLDLAWYQNFCTYLLEELGQGL